VQLHANAQQCSQRDSFIHSTVHSSHASQRPHAGRAASIVNSTAPETCQFKFHSICRRPVKGVAVNCVTGAELCTQQNATWSQSRTCINSSANLLRSYLRRPKPDYRSLQQFNADFHVLRYIYIYE